MTQEQAALAVGVTSRTLRNWKAAPVFRRELERQRKRLSRQSGSAPARSAKAPARRESDDRRRDHPPTPPAQQEPTAEAEEKLPSGFRDMDGVPLWGDSDGWPRTPEEHAERARPQTQSSPRPNRFRAQLSRFGGKTTGVASGAVDRAYRLRLVSSSRARRSAGGSMPRLAFTFADTLRQALAGALGFSPAAPLERVGAAPTRRAPRVPYLERDNVDWQS